MAELSTYPSTTKAAGGADTDIREVVREKYAQAARAATTQQARSCCGPIELSDADQNPATGVSILAE